MAYSIICECGKKIEGLSENQRDFNLQTHKKSKKHRELIKKCKEALK